MRALWGLLLCVGFALSTPVSAQPSLSAKLPDGSQRAFPSAEGFGAAAKGGRGGKVLFVSNLNEAGPGSLRACIKATMPRTCVFEVSGTITLNTAALVVTHPFLTIAGETAPGGGIAIRNGPLQPRPALEIKTHDVILRHLRLRPGPHGMPSCCSGALGFYTSEARDIIADHISASWGSDETIDSEHATNLTVQWSFVTEPLLNGGPGKRNRARNMLMTHGGDISVHHTLFALGKFRNPQFQTAIPGSVVDIVNNVMYSPIWQYVVTLSDKHGPMQANIVGNYKMAGTRAIYDRLIYPAEDGSAGFAIFADDNLDETYMPDAGDQSEAVTPALRRYLVGTRFDAPLVQTSSPKVALREVLACAGATRPARDAVDQRIVSLVERREGGLVKRHPETVGGWPDLVSTPMPPDADRDGMADAWELSVGLAPADPEDGRADADGDGWTNFEEYLHELAGDGAGMVKLDGSAPLTGSCGP
ncbi:hypothetical protein [Cognatishimia sp. MH4019]|uniref:hypothetical protein n=1 Tax=Cognatishimia sp. MH4019 TaxID=2854030 RepID=UPI001CD223E6|nr:hypothetical protein [Cognatishimia sp. MH4019]